MTTLDVRGFFMDYPMGLWAVIGQLSLIILYLYAIDKKYDSDAEKSKDGFYAINLSSSLFLLLVGIFTREMSGAIIVFEGALSVIFFLIMRKRVADQARRLKHYGYKY